MDTNVARRRLESEWERLLQTQDAVEQEKLSEESEQASSGELSHDDQHLADSASDLCEREMEFSVRDQVVLDIQELKDALARLDAGTYGRCVTCGIDIPDSRLAAVPATRFCVEHERLWELRSLSTPMRESGFDDRGSSAETFVGHEASRHLDLLADDDLLEEPFGVSAEVAAMHLERTEEVE